jgi:hypothetical protein
MYQPGQLQLQSMALLQGHTGDRPSFEATVCRLFSARPYQVFAMPPGLLFLEMRNKAGATKDNTNALVAGAVLGGMIGACIASALVNSNTMEAETGLDMCSEEELFELARKRKRSFVSKYDDVSSVAITAPSGWDRLFAPSTLAGYITLRDKTLGKVKMEIHDQAAMSVAVDALPRRLAERVWVNVEFDQRNTRFVPKRR